MVEFFHGEWFLEKNKMSSTPHLLWSGSDLSDVYYSYEFVQVLILHISMVILYHFYA